MNKKTIPVFTLLLVLSLIPAAVTVSARAPSVSAEGAFLTEIGTGDTIYEKNADARLPMASTTKIMTALVTLENADLSAAVRIPREAVGVEGSSVCLKEGEETTVSDLLYAVMLESANDAAAALAVTVGGSVEGFAAMMNEKAAELGLENTHFANPHGLDDPEHYTSARDLARLTAAALCEPEFEKIVSTRSVEAFGGSRTLVNHNRLLRTLDGSVGVKTGFTKRSGRCLVSAVRRDGVLTVAVTLNDPCDWLDHKNLHEYGQSLYSRRTLAEKGGVSLDVPVIGGTAPRVRCENAEELSVVLKNDRKIVRKIEADRFIPAPVEKGDAVARAVFRAEGKEIASVPLLAAESVPEAARKRSFFELLLDFLGRKTG